jgi:hypothetical protein
VLLCFIKPILGLETEVEKRKKKSGVSMSLSVPLDKGDRVSDPSSLPPPIGEKNELN